MLRVRAKRTQSDRRKCSRRDRYTEGEVIWQFANARAKAFFVGDDAPLCARLVQSSPSRPCFSSRLRHVRVSVKAKVLMKFPVVSVRSVSPVYKRLQAGFKPYQLYLNDDVATAAARCQDEARAVKVWARVAPSVTARCCVTTSRASPSRRSVVWLVEAVSSVSRA